MAKSFTVTVTFTHAELKAAIKSAGLKITDRAAFNTLLSDPKFHKSLACDLKQTWELYNAEDGGEGLSTLFSDVAEFR